ncbi:MAG: energy-coupling factor transporter transmembrane protein EcfT [Erysipelotrichaceae bacterium]|nr:energy-coupling factor transporter transmembrane protein EcfT [Erysipelotrichaceae bacterium]
MKNIALGRYVPYNTFIHRLDPRIKLFMLVLLTVGVFMPIGINGFIFLSIFTLLMMICAKVRIKTFFKSLKAMWFMLLLLFVFNVIFIRSGEVLLTIGNYPIYKEAIFQSLYIFFRLALMLAFTMILTSTTKPLDITYGLEFYLSPLKVIRFPAHEIAMIISIALRFIPTLLGETNRLINAQASRGVDYENGSLKEKIGAIISLIIPLFISSFQRSDELASAMVVRGYNPEGKRTRYKVYKLKWSDCVSFVLVILVFVVAINVKRVSL